VYAWQDAGAFSGRKAVEFLLFFLHRRPAGWNKTMALSESEYIRVAERASKLGCRLPTGLAVMPENFDTAAARQDLVVRIVDASPPHAA
jgi:hypothetical protein